MARPADVDERGRRSESAPALGRIKGAAFGEFLGWYQLRRDRDKIARVVAEVSDLFPGEIDADAASFGVVASRWYPAAVVHTLVDRLTDGWSEEQLAVMADEAADYIMGRTLRGVYKTLFSLLATPERNLKYVDRLWSLHYDSGTPIGTKLSETCHAIRTVGWTAHHPVICRMNMAASRPMHVAMGCKNVSYRRIRCISEGGADCESHVTWDER